MALNDIYGLQETNTGRNKEINLNNIFAAIGDLPDCHDFIQSETANFVTVCVSDDAKVNGAALIAAYTAAKALTPNGSALATDNRACVIVPPAKYDLDYGGDSPAPGNITVTPDDVGSNPVTWYYKMSYYYEDVGDEGRSLISNESSFTIGDSTTEIIIDGGTIPSWAESMTVILGVASQTYTHYVEILSFPQDVYDTFVESAGIEEDLENVLVHQDCVPLTLDTEFVDIIGLTTDRALQHIYGTPPALNSGVIVQTADDVHISNLTVEILTAFGTPVGDNTDSAAYFPSTNLPNTVIDNVYFIGTEGDDIVLFSMRLVVELSGTFTNCLAGSNSFGVGDTISGTFIDCTGGDSSFGTGGTASGTFTSCVGGDASFGKSGTASGTFTNCTGGHQSFGGGGTASGTFNNCVGEVGSFGGAGTASGTFNSCVGGEDSFGGDGGIASGTFSFCKVSVSAFLSPTASVATIELVAGGTGYTADDELTVVGGTGTAATIKVLTVNAGVILTAEILTVGSYTVEPANAVAVTGGTGNDDATFNLTWNEGHIYGCVDDTGFIAELNWDD